ncbi:MAG TPA: preprotein translocase subunit SecG [Tepidisphaeraceae bacterium]|jgi:preprotein translocase subunit SecG
MLTFSFWTLYVFFMLTALILILLVLIQKGRGGGLSSAFGGGGGGSSAFGAKTGDMLTWGTSVIFGVFMLLAIGLNLVANRRQENQNAAIANAPMVQIPAPVSGK